MAYLTFFDVVEHLITSSFGGPQDAEQRDIRTAVHRAYSEVTQIRDWSYYTVHGRIVTQPSYSSGTITSSGTTVTLTGGTWPAWVAAGDYIAIGRQVAEIASRTSGSILVLNSDLSLKENVSGEGYRLYRSTYPLPADFRNMDEPTDEWNWWSGLYVTPDQSMKLERTVASAGKPYNWTVIPNPNGQGWSIRLIGHPTTVETIDFTYRRYPADLRRSGHEANSRAGTIERATDTGSVELTGATTFQSSMVGGVLRAGDSTNVPGPLTSISPYTFEAKIAGVTDNNTLTLTESGAIAAGTKYLITDVIDVPQHMQNCIYSAAEYWLARLRNQKTDAAYGMYQRDLRLAMEMDQLAPLSGRSRRIWHDGGWRSPLQRDMGV